MANASKIETEKTKFEPKIKTKEEILKDAEEAFKKKREEDQTADRVIHTFETKPG